MKISPDYASAAERELIRWPGASVTFQMGKVHPVAIVAYNHKTYKVFLPGTPGDSRRGAANFVKDLRRGLRELGAQMSINLRENRLLTDLRSSGVPPKRLLSPLSEDLSPAGKINGLGR